MAAKDPMPPIGHKLLYLHYGKTFCIVIVECTIYPDMGIGDDIILQWDMNTDRYILCNDNWLHYCLNR